MTLQEFRTSADEPPGLAAPLVALWQDNRGRWEAAHHLVQEDSSRDAAWVHAYLHRKEGDIGNARYWYARAERSEFTGTLEAEWEAIASALLG